MAAKKSAKAAKAAKPAGEPKEFPGSGELERAQLMALAWITAIRRLVNELADEVSRYDALTSNPDHAGAATVLRTVISEKTLMQLCWAMEEARRAADELTVGDEGSVDALPDLPAACRAAAEAMSRN